MDGLKLLEISQMPNSTQIKIWIPQVLLDLLETRGHTLFEPIFKNKHITPFFFFWQQL